MKPITKPSVMARIYVYCNAHITSANINVDFSVVDGADGVNVPSFCHWHDDTGPLGGIDDLNVNAYAQKEDVTDRLADGIYGYELGLSMDEPRFNHKLTAAIKAGNRTSKRLAKLWDEEGMPGSYAMYLSQLFRVMKVKYITFESYSELTGRSKWTNYTLSEIPNLLNEAVYMASEQKYWGISKVSSNSEAA